MKIIAYDLGTGGIKASLYSEDLQALAKSFISYPTYYPASNMHEQCPEDWWQGVISSTKKLISITGIDAREIGALSLSGHSLVTVPLNHDGQLLSERVPIWSDTRAVEEAKDFFNRISEKDWYMTTGNGFPAPCYSIFKLMWMKKHDSKTFSSIFKILGSKDYINYRLTGVMRTDFSYASGCGAYDLLHKKLRNDFLAAAEIPASIFPEIVPSHTILGCLTETAAEEIGLSKDTIVTCGGVDNACMALGAVGPDNGKIYTSLGSSSWIPVNSQTPILDFKKRPYVFAHIEENMFTSAFSIFAGGSSFAWAKDTLCKDLSEDEHPFDRMSQMAQTVPIGSDGIFFNPSLAGGTSQDKSIHIRGAFVGLHLGTSREAMVRAAMEGICMNLKESISFLRQHINVSDEILFCGGGSKSPFWMQMFADVFNTNILKTNIDQDAASLGAAAIAMRALKIWKDYSKIPSLHHIERISKPDPVHVLQYEKLQPVFIHICNVLADLGDYMMYNKR